MNFQENLALMPEINHLKGLDIADTEGHILHHIPASPGKLGSLKLYNALAQQFNRILNTASAKQGLVWFAEHVADAQANPGKHPNIDLLLRVQQQNLELKLQPVTAE